MCTCQRRSAPVRYGGARYEVLACGRRRKPTVGKRGRAAPGFTSWDTGENVTPSIWHSGDVTLYLGDCLEVLPTLEAGSVDAVITDPPYGIAFVSGHYRNGNPHGAMHEDDITNAVWLAFLARVVKPTGAIYSFTRWDVLGTWKRLFEFFGLHVKNCIVWDKQRTGMGDLRGAYAPQHEMILFASRGRHLLKQGRPPDIISAPRIGATRDHPTEKPVPLLIEFITNSTDIGDTVFDPFMGSGTTGVACVQTGRKFIGIEISEEYFRIAQKRIMEAQSQIRIPFESMSQSDDSLHREAVDRQHYLPSLGIGETKTIDGLSPELSDLVSNDEQ